MRLVTIDTNRHLLDVLGDRGGPLQVDKVTGMPNPHTARSQVALPHPPHVTVEPMHTQRQQPHLTAPFCLSTFLD
jgi:hypothetical protein